MVWTELLTAPASLLVSAPPDLEDEVLCSRREMGLNTRVDGVSSYVSFCIHALYVSHLVSSPAKTLPCGDRHSTCRALSS